MLARPYISRRALLTGAAATAAYATLDEEAWAANPTLVVSTQTTGAAGGGTSASVDTTGATLLIAITSNYSGEGSGENVPTVSDSKSNTWTKVIDTYNVTNEVMSCLFYVNSTTPTVGSGHTFTVSCVAGFVAIFAFSGTFVSSPFGAYTTQENQSGNTSYQFASAITPTTSPSVIVSGLSTGGGSGGSSYSIDSGMTITATQNYTNGVSEGGAAAYLIQSVAASLQPTWTWGMTSPSSMLIASFNVAGSTGRSRIIQ